MRVVFILPCCMGDVVMATAVLGALRRLYPDAHLTWAIGRHAAPIVAHDPRVDKWLDTGNAALPTRTSGDLLRFARRLRAGRYDVAVSLVRSWTMSAAVGLSGIPLRAGLNSGGQFKWRGLGYNVRAPLDPAHPRHEVDIYLDVIRALAQHIGQPDPTPGARPLLTVNPAAKAAREKLRAAGVQGDYWLVHPGGGQNPGMAMDAKRYPPGKLAELAARLTKRLNLLPVLIGAPGDLPLANAVQAGMQPAGIEAVSLAGQLSIPETVAMAAGARLYLGNDTGFTHVAAAVGTHTVMILGPSDPRRYAPYGESGLAVWKPTALLAGGVAAGVPPGWTWEQDGISVNEAEAQIAAWLSSHAAPGT